MTGGAHDVAEHVHRVPQNGLAVLRLVGRETQIVVELDIDGFHGKPIRRPDDQGATGGDAAGATGGTATGAVGGAGCGPIGVGVGVAVLELDAGVLLDEGDCDGLSDPSEHAASKNDEIINIDTLVKNLSAIEPPYLE